MSKNSKRDAWTYGITVLLVINLFVMNNYITTKAVAIIEAKNNTSVSTSNNINSLKTGAIGAYTSIVDKAKKAMGLNVAIVSGDSNQTKNEINSTVVLKTITPKPILAIKVIPVSTLNSSPNTPAELNVSVFEVKPSTNKGDLL